VAIAALFDFGRPPGPQSWDAYDRVNRELAGGQAPTTAAELGDGMLAHFVGTTQDGRSMIVSVFESPEAMDRFMQHAAPLLERETEAGARPEPHVEILSLYNVLT
jgi:hypothetical protein